MKSSLANLVYELPHELPNDLRLRILGNKGILGKPQIWDETWPSAQSPFQKLKFGSSSQKTCESRYQTFLVLSGFTGFLYFVPNNLPMIVGSTYPSRLLLRVNNANLSIFFSAWNIHFPRYSMNNKISFLLSFLVNSRSFFPTFHKLLTIFFSLYLSFFLSYSTGCYFAFLHNKPVEPTFQKMGEGWGRGDKVKKIKFTGNIQIKSTNL